MPKSLFRLLIVAGLMLNLAAPYTALAMLSPSTPPPPTPVIEDSLSGILTLVWGDGRSGKAEESTLQVFLTTAAGQKYELQLDPQQYSPGSLRTWIGKTVRVSGRVLAGSSMTNPAPQPFEVTALELVQPQTLRPDAPQGVFGSKPWVSIMCKFNDVAAEPKPLSYFEGMYGNSPGQLNHYWSEQSYAQADVSGSAAYGWFTLPRPHSGYMIGTTFNLDLAASDCTAVANSAVNFALFEGINMMFNDELNGLNAWGGAHIFNPALDGKSFFYVTWEPPWGYENVAVMAHEMGHGFGLPHSSYSASAVYENDWDVMSDTWENCAAFSDPTYGCMGQGTIGYHKDLLGWLPAGKVQTVSLGQQVTLTLDWLGSASAANYRMIKIPISGSSRFYTIEARGYPTSGAWKTYDYKFYSYLQPFGHQGIIIHEVDPARSSPAYIIDLDVNGNSSDASAIFVPGESYTIPGTVAVMTVLSAGTGGLTVEVDFGSTLFTKGAPINNATGVSLLPTLSWTSASGATDYQYCLDTSNDDACAGSWVSSGMNTSVTLASSLNNGTTYYWQVRASTPGGSVYADSAAWFSFTTASAPAAFNKTAPSHGAIGLSTAETIWFSWQASSGASSYEYCLNYEPVASSCWYTYMATGTSIGLNGLTAGKTYFWQMRAIGPGGSTNANSGQYWQFTTAGGTPPGAFSKNAPASGVTGQATSVNISWYTSSSATSYAYCYDTINDNVCSGDWTSTTGTSAMLSGLSSATTYYWQVRSTNGEATYANSGAYWSFTTAAPAAPGAFNKSAPANGASGLSTTPTLSWGGSSGVTSYAYCYDTTNDNACSSWINTTATSVGLSGLASGTTYYWQVRATNAGGTTYANASATAYWSFTTQVAPPGAFNKSSPANGASGQTTNPVLAWNASSGASSYDYCIDLINDNACANWQNTTATSVGINGLTSGVTYYWQVRANNAGGTTYANGSAGAHWSFSTLPDPPGAFNKSSPANAAGGQSISPSLTWAASSGATSYDYCYDTSHDNACTDWTNTTATSAALSGLAGGTTYYWQVRANNAGGTTYANGGAYWNFSTQGSPPGAFNKSAPSNGATGQSLTPTISWTASSGAASYDYCYDATNDSACASWTNTTLTSISLSGLANSTTYYWQVRANNPSGTTYANNGTYWSFTTQVAAPGAFSKSLPPNATTGQSLTPTISWVSSSGAVSYDFCYDMTNDGACTTWFNTTATSAALSGLDNGTTYYWQVRANNPGGTTYANSGTHWSFTTQVAAPGAFNKSAPTNGATGQSLTPMISWAPSSGATNYDYCYDTTNDSACATWMTTPATSAALSGLANSTTYYWQVRANNPGGTTYANSGAHWSFTTQIAAPAAFNKSAPPNGVTGQLLTPAISWAASSGAASYDYCYDMTNDSACTTWTTTTATSAALSGLAGATAYYWQVRANNAGGTTYANGGTYWSFTTQVVAPGAFNKSAPASHAVNQALSPTISWAASSGAASYDYCYDMTNDNTCAAWVNTPNTSAPLVNLSADTDYYWQVRANNAAGTTYANGGAAVYWRFTTQAEPTTLPGAFSLITPLDGAVDQPVELIVSWLPSQGATSYDYCYTTDAGTPCTNWTNTTATSAVLHDLEHGTTYYWHVRANNAGGSTYANGSESMWHFTTLWRYIYLPFVGK